MFFNCCSYGGDDKFYGGDDTFMVEMTPFYGGDDTPMVEMTSFMVEMTLLWWR